MILMEVKKEVSNIDKQKRFIVTVDYQGEEDIYSGDMQLLFNQFKKLDYLNEIYGDIQKIVVEDYDSQEVE